MADIIIDGTAGANRFLLLDSTGKIPAVDGSQVTAIAAGNIATGTIPIARIDTGTTANKIVKLDGNAKLPALDGSLITNVPGATKNASDPTISTNPSGGVGTEWHNTTSGEVYICTDATAGENVWINVGGGSGNIRSFYQGENYGYGFGGNYPQTKDIQQFAFASDGDATDVGDSYAERMIYASSSSATHGYQLGGKLPPWVDTNTIFKFAFVSGGTMTDIANLTQSIVRMTGHSTESYGFIAGGAPTTDRIERFSHTSDSDATDWENLTAAKSTAGTGSSSSDHGYVAGGSTSINVIERFPFASQTASADVGDLAVSCGAGASTSSVTHGYLCGGGESPIFDQIQKFAFASSGNATDIANLLSGCWGQGGQSSTISGYQTAGSDGSGSAATDTIQKHSFSADTDATDVGNCTHTNNYGGGGCQY